MQIRGLDNANIEVTEVKGELVKVEIYVRGSRTYCLLPLKKAEKLSNQLTQTIKKIEMGVSKHENRD